MAQDAAQGVTSRGFGRPGEVPGWVGYALLPLLNLLAALVLSGLVILVIGENPLDVLALLVTEAVGYPEAIGYTLYYTTSYIFTGLAVAIAFHCGLFNIGGEGQAYLGGLGAGLVGLALTGWPWPVAALGAVALSALFGAAWGAVPGWLQAKRGSHIVITTIMFNFIAAAIMTYLLVDVLIRPGSQSPETREFDPGVWLPTMDRALGWIGVAIPASPLNLSFLWALACCALFYLFLWRTRWGYEIRTVGRNERAAVYAGISPARNIILAMAISGALAGFVGVNEIMGVQHRILLNFTGGVGFVGIAVALMGRNHPVGIILAALLFGVLAQGGGQVSFEYPTVNRELVMVIQGLVILFAGALENLFKPRVEALFRRRGGGHDGGTAHG
ncbi:ABC transporter permease [Azospirillum brasilense]|uniref:ABC transporter permease n=2 Tax=Azospirillum brasilense TaxID=192 RepID=UPI000E6A3642|nr:ABC transporter permease [Azospirillum brasilense]RIV97980.1 ABC transporter permease [Azospirillum brasilense]